MNTLLSTNKPFTIVAQSPEVETPWEALEAERLLSNAHKVHQDLMDVLDALGWQNLPTGLVATIQDDLLGFVDELKGHFKNACPFVALRRERITFWADQVLKDPTLEMSAIEALVVKGL